MKTQNANPQKGLPICTGYWDALLTVWGRLVSNFFLDGRSCAPYLALALVIPLPWFSPPRSAVTCRSPKLPSVLTVFVSMDLCMLCLFEQKTVSISYDKFPILSFWISVNNLLSIKIFLRWAWFFSFWFLFHFYFSHAVHFPQFIFFVMFIASCTEGTFEITLF